MTSKPNSLCSWGPQSWCYISGTGSRRCLGEVCWWETAIAPRAFCAPLQSGTGQETTCWHQRHLILFCFLARVGPTSLLLTWRDPNKQGTLFISSLCCSLSVGVWGDHVGDCDPRANPLCWHWECRNLQLPHQWEQAEAATGVPGRCVSTSSPCRHMVPWEVWLTGRIQGQLADPSTWIHPLSITQMRSL